MTINAQTAQSLLSASAAMIEAARTVALDAVVPEEEQEVEKESEWYRASIPMKKEHQKLLWDYCKTRGLDYIDMLALISVESNFFEKCSSSRGTYRGYFQISKGNCANIAKTLGTKNDPMDGAISINWGTAMFSWILKDERVTKLPEEKRLDAALSIYQRGTVGYDKKGLSTSYLKIFYKKRAKVAALFAE
ncbi:MAG: lytic transglycosylase domain-containing protein [Clostridiales bacterium]|nr:lytic transglycosylase domain-containing protein [Clostridiales bacterium]